MQIVIDIPDKKWELIQDNQYCGIIDDLLYQNIKNGTPFKEVFEDIKAEIETDLSMFCFDDWGNENGSWTAIKEIIDNHISGKEQE